MTTPPREDVRPDAPEPDATADAEDAAAEEEGRAEAAARLRRGRVATAVVVGALVLVVGVVALLGGFERRKDLVTPVAVGSVVATGPYEVTLSSATVQHKTSRDVWEVVVTGTARTTGTTSISPSTGDNGFVYAKDVRTAEVQPIDAVGIGASSSYEDVDNLTPGLPAVPWTLTFRFAGDPGADVLLAVFQQEYTTPYLFSDEMGWRATSDASTMTMPLQRLPEEQY